MARAVPRWLEPLWQDVRFSVRGLLRSPGTTVAALLALALGIGANAALFSVARGTLWREPPLREPDRLVVIWQEVPGMEQPSRVTGEIFQEWRRRTRSFEGFAALSQGRMNVTRPGRPELVQQAWVTTDFFTVAGVEMAAGRGFREGEVRRKERVAVISQKLFQERFQSETARLRQGIVLDGVRYAVVGVAPAGLDLFGDWQVWLPDAFRTENLRGWHFLNVLARLRPGVTPEGADPELEAVSRFMAKSDPAFYGGRTVRTTSLAAERMRRISRPLSLLGLCAAFVLLIACADVAGLLLARGVGREREIAVRATLGADRGRLARGMLVESLLLFLAGALAAMPLAFWGALGLAAFGPWDVPRTGPHAGLLLVSLGLGLATGVLFGLLPALSLTGRRLTESLKDARPFASRWGGLGLRDLLVAGQVALTVVLIVGAGLLMRGFDSLRRVDVGIRISGILTADLKLPEGRYADHQASAQAYARVLESVRRLPGVESAALVDSLPFALSRVAPVIVEGRRPPAVQGFPLLVRFVSPDYFKLLDIALVKGRLFQCKDGPDAVVVNEAMAVRYWPGENPVGKRFRASRANSERMLTVVGVVKSTRQKDLQTPWLEAYRPLLHWPPESASVLVWAPGGPQQWAGPLASAVQKADHGLTSSSPRLLEDIVDGQLAENRFQLLVTLFFAGLAVLLAMVGIYGVVSYAVTRRTHEIGVRVALGAAPGDVLRRVLVQGMAPVLAGLALGLGAARLLSGLFADQLYEVRPGDPLTFSVAAMVIMSAGLVATYFPAHRATQVEPMAALREE
ncbi:MAG TPA: ABC transporter permease [Thermoanaerobaculia bacterium]